MSLSTQEPSKSPKNNDDHLPLFDCRFVGANWRDPESHSIAHRRSLAKHDAMIEKAILEGHR